MTPWVLLAAVLAGGVGSAVRFAVDGAVLRRWPGPLPWGTALVNTTGSFLLGALVGVVRVGALPGAAEVVLGTGFLGGYTTFSTASLEVVRLLQQGRGAAAAAHAGLVLGAGLLAAGAGLVLGARVG